MSEHWTHIHFDLNKITLDELFSVETELSEKGVYFDTGTCIPNGPREWHTDWSLEGPMSVADLTKHLDELGIEYTTVDVPKSDQEE